MTRSRGFAVGVATLVLAIGYWFGFLSFGTSTPVALGIMAVALVFAVAAMASFSGATGVGDLAFRASIEALGVALALLFSYQVSGIEAFVVAAPVVAAGVGGARSLHPTDDRFRRWIRVGFAVGAATAVTWIYQIDHTVYGLIAPVLPFPALIIADRVFDRGQGIIAETAPD